MKLFTFSVLLAAVLLLEAMAHDVMITGFIEFGEE
jgi:hypothetical protein